MTSDLILCLERSSLSPLAWQTTSSPSKDTSNSFRIRLSASSMYRSSERKEYSLSSSSIPETLTSTDSPVPTFERSTVWSNRAYAALAKHSSRVLPNAFTIMSAVWSTRTYLSMGRVSPVPVLLGCDGSRRRPVDVGHRGIGGSTVERREMPEGMPQARPRRIWLWVPGPVFVQPYTT